MTSEGIEELLAIGESVLRFIGKKVDEAEVFITRGSSWGLGIENNRIKTVSGGRETGIAIRIIKDRRLGFSYTPDPGSLSPALELALQGAAISPQKELSFPFNEKYHTVPDLLDKRVLDLTPEDGNEMVGHLIDSACDVSPDITVSGGGLSFGEGEVVIMNSGGMEVSEHLSGMGASIHTVCDGTDPSSGFEYDSSHLLVEDLDGIGRRSAELAVCGQNKVKIETASLPVIFKPDAISSLLEFILVPALYGIKAEKGESVYSDRIGEEIVDPGITLVDDPTMPDGENAMKMDDEGVPSRCHELIRNGVLMDYLYTLGTGSEFGHPSTSSGLRGGGQDHSSPISTSGRNIMVQGNTVDEEELISEIREGLLVHDIMGAHTSNQASGDFSVTASILFRIVNGEIAEPVSQAMLGGNLPEYLKKVSGLGSNYRRLSGGLSPVGFYIPSIRIDDVKVTGEL